MKNKYLINVSYTMEIEAEDSTEARDIAQDANLPYYKTDSLEIDSVIRTA